MTGSSLPSLAAAVRSVEYFSRALYEPSASGLVTFAPPRTPGTALRREAAVTPFFSRISADWFGLLAAMPISRCSVETYSSPICCISFSAWAMAAVSWRLACGCEVLDPDALGSATKALRTAAPMACGSPPAASIRERATPFSWRSSASMTCRVSTCAFPAADAL